jgi:hypothetical protein
VSKAKQADTPETRRLAARRYITAMPILPQIVARIAQAHGEPDAAQKFMRQLRQDLIETATIDALVRNFTLIELDAMAHFYSSPEFRSANLKMQSYMVQLEWAIEPEIERAMRAAFGR